MSLKTQTDRVVRGLISARARVIALLALCAAAFILGGGARGDIDSLILLRPTAFLLLAYAIAVGNIDDLRRHWGLVVFGLAILAIAFFHVVPLPPSVWSVLPGREIVVRADMLTGLNHIARPLALNVTEARNGLFSLIVPVAALALIAVQRQDWRRPVIAAILLLGTLSVLLGVLQVLGPSNGPFYTYRITNGNSPVGLFANRNHNAVFLASLLPVLAILGSGGRVPVRGQRDGRPLRRGGAWVGAVLALVLIVASGSRAGLLLAVLAIALVPFVLGSSARDLLLPMPPPARARHAPRFILIAGILRHWRIVATVTAVGVILLALLGRFSSTIERLAGGGDGRSEVWAASLPLVGKYFPWGSGIGSFVDVFKRDEPYALVGPKYVNHAHNDLLEVAITTGLPGMLLMALMILWIARRTVTLWHGRKDTSFTAQVRRLGLVVLMLLLLASLVDYPLRTPAMATLFVVAAAWLTAEPRPNAGSSRRAAKVRTSDGR